MKNKDMNREQVEAQLAERLLLLKDTLSELNAELREKLKEYEVKEGE